MEGRQKDLYEEIMEIANKIKDGTYGYNDDINIDCIEDDLGTVIQAW